VHDRARRDREPHLQVDRAAREDDRAIRLEDRRHVRLWAQLGEEPRHVALVELVVAHAGLAQRGRHRRHDGAALQKAVATQQDLAATTLEVVPELEGPHCEADVVGIGMGEAKGARGVARTAEVVADRMLLEQRHAPAALGQDARGRGAHRPRPDHHGRPALTHDASSLRSASTAASRSARTTSAT
jgi:hypothetical protein